MRTWVNLYFISPVSNQSSVISPQSSVIIHRTLILQPRDFVSTVIAVENPVCKPELTSKDFSELVQHHYGIFFVDSKLSTKTPDNPKAQLE
jgi:hypothetical protein